MTVPESTGMILECSHDLRCLIKSLQDCQEVSYFAFAVGVLIVQNGSVRWMVLVSWQTQCVDSDKRKTNDLLQL